MRDPGLRPCLGEVLLPRAYTLPAVVSATPITGESLRHEPAECSTALLEKRIQNVENRAVEKSPQGKSDFSHFSS